MRRGAVTPPVDARVRGHVNDFAVALPVNDLLTAPPLSKANLSC